MSAVGEPAAAAAGSTPQPPLAPVAPVSPPTTGAGGSAGDASTPSVADLTRSVANSVFAELRRAGVLRGRASEPQAPAPEPSATPAPDHNRLRSLDRALGITGFAARLDEAAYARIERNFLAEGPDDARAWVTSYFAGLGVAHSTPPPAATAPTPQASPSPTPQPALPATTPAQSPTTRPVSDSGGPPAPRQHLEDVDLLSASVADREFLLKSKGIRWYTDTLYEQSKTRTFRVR